MTVMPWLKIVDIRRVRLLAITLAVALAYATGYAQGEPAGAAVQGRWVVTAGEHNGKPMDAIKNGVMTITGDVFEVRTASGNVLKGTLRLDAAKKPSQIDFLHADGTRWEAIYEVAGDSFRINYVTAGEKDPRPTTFATSEKTEESLVVMRRQAK